MLQNVMQHSGEGDFILFNKITVSTKNFLRDKTARIDIRSTSMSNVLLVRWSQLCKFVCFLSLSIRCCIIVSFTKLWATKYILEKSPLLTMHNIQGFPFTWRLNYRNFRLSNQTGKNNIYVWQLTMICLVKPALALENRYSIYIRLRNRSSVSLSILFITWRKYLLVCSPVRLSFW